MQPAHPVILIVEDEAIVAADLEQRLEKLGYRSMGAAASGDEALALSRLRRPDIALLDIRLQGGMDGIALAKILREEMEVPVVFLTGNADESTVARAKAAESFGYLLKPFDERLLQITIDMALYRHQMELERKRLTAQLEQALTEVKTLSGLLSICAECKKIENDDGDWERLEAYVSRHTSADFSHSLCPGCVTKLYPEIADKVLSSAKAMKSDRSV